VEKTLVLAARDRRFDIDPVTSSGESHGH